jgi:hypothetical protein
MSKSLKLDIYDPCNLPALAQLNMYLQTKNLNKHYREGPDIFGDIFAGVLHIPFDDYIFCDTNYRSDSEQNSSWLDLIYPLVKYMQEQVCKHTGKNYIPKHSEINIMPPGGKIKPHIDKGYVTNGPRVHLVIFTNSDVKFIVDNESFYFQPGTCFQFNNFLLHSVENNHSTNSRIHLVADFVEDHEIESCSAHQH